MTLSMPISPAGLDQGIICPVLSRLAAFHPAITSDDARAMMLRTAAAESELMWLEEHEGGPSLGYWQMLPSTAKDTIGRVPGLLGDRLSPYLCGGFLIKTAMTWNPWAACALARAYWWIADPEPMPPWRDLNTAAERWKLHWNTHLGAGTPEGFIERCQRTGVEDYLAKEL